MDIRDICHYEIVTENLAYCFDCILDLEIKYPTLVFDTFLFPTRVREITGLSVPSKEQLVGNHIPRSHE